MSLKIQRTRDLPTDPVQSYLDRLVKLIPGEVVALYMSGRQVLLGDIAPTRVGELPAAERSYWIGWTLFCLVAIVLVRAYATRTPGKPPQWVAVAIAAVSYVIWVYTMGDVFTYWKVWDAKLSALVMFGWTFLIPLVYKGD